MTTKSFTNLKQAIIASGHPLGAEIKTEDERIAQRIAEDRRNLRRQNVQPAGAPILRQQRPR